MLPLNQSPNAMLQLSLQCRAIYKQWAVLQSGMQRWLAAERAGAAAPRPPACGNAGVDDTHCHKPTGPLHQSTWLTLSWAELPAMYLLGAYTLCNLPAVTACSEHEGYCLPVPSPTLRTPRPPPGRNSPLITNISRQVTDLDIVERHFRSLPAVPPFLVPAPSPCDASPPSSLPPRPVTMPGLRAAARTTPTSRCSADHGAAARRWRCCRCAPAPSAPGRCCWGTRGHWRPCCSRGAGRQGESQSTRSRGAGGDG